MEAVRPVGTLTLLPTDLENVSDLNWIYIYINGRLR